MGVQPGVYDEEGLKRFDLTLARAAAWNIKIIYTFVNYWAAYGGMQWYSRCRTPTMPCNRVCRGCVPHSLSESDVVLMVPVVGTASSDAPRCCPCDAVCRLLRL